MPPAPALVRLLWRGSAGGRRQRNCGGSRALSDMLRQRDKGAGRTLGRVTPTQSTRARGSRVGARRQCCDRLIALRTDGRRQVGRRIHPRLMFHGGAYSIPDSIAGSRTGRPARGGNARSVEFAAPRTSDIGRNHDYSALFGQSTSYSDPAHLDRVRRDCDPRDPAPVRLEWGEGARFHRLALFRLPGWLRHRVAQPGGPIEGWNGVF